MLKISLRKITSCQKPQQPEGLTIWPSFFICRALQGAISSAWMQSTTGSQPCPSLPTPVSLCPGTASRRASSRAPVYSATLHLCHPQIILYCRNLQAGNKSTFHLLLLPQVNREHLLGGGWLWADRNRVQPSFTPCSSVQEPQPLGHSHKEMYLFTRPVMPEKGMLEKQELCVVHITCYT